MSYFLAPALVTLRDEVNARYPDRDKTTDGWIGDPDHAARVSDHNPCWTCTGRSQGIVRALDLDIGPDGDPTRDLRADVLNAAIGDPRVWYVIHDRVIYSRTFGFAPRAYTGKSPHDEHIHVSLNGANGLPGDPGNFDTTPWLDYPRPARVGPQLDHAIADLRRAIRHHRGKGHTAIVHALVADLRALKATRRKYPA